MNVAVVAPAGTVTEVGMVTAVLVELSETTSPDGPAALARVTVPVEVNPPYPDAGEAVRLEIVATLMVRVAVLTDPSADPVMTACV